MHTLLVTNILLAVIVLCFTITTLLLAIALVHIIGATRKIKHIITMFDDDAIRARSTIIAIKDLVIEKIFGKEIKKTTRTKKK
jgi:hypothetical protein